MIAEIVPVPTVPGGMPLLMSLTRELPLPWSAIDRYAQRYGLEGQAFAEFERLMLALDAEYLAIAAEWRDSRVSAG